MADRPSSEPPRPGRLGASAASALAAAGRALAPYAARIGLGLAGLAAGIYGAAAGFLIGFMVDEALASRAARRYFRKPEASPPPEPEPGLAAAAALARLEAWPGAERGGAGGAAQGAELFGLLARSLLGLSPRAARELSRLSAAAAEEALAADLPFFSRQLATSGSEASRALLARYGYERLRAGGAALDHEKEEALLRIFADSGIGREAAGAARRAVFPAYRDPWEILGLEAGADRAEVKRAFRRLSRLSHPDLACANGEPAEAGEAAAAFRELKEAYEALTPQPARAGKAD